MNKEEYNYIKSVFSTKILNLNKKFGNNPAFFGWSEDDIKSDGKNYTCIGEPTIVYKARYCAVSGFVFGIVNGKYSILANKRGSGTPDYKGYWNAPCGYLEKFESAKLGIQREIFEECGFLVDGKDLKEIFVETKPEECNNGNVTIRHKAFLGKIIPYYSAYNGGELNEVDDIKWIPIDDIDKYEWAFNHLNTIKSIVPSKFKRRILEFIYKYFMKYNSKYYVR